MEKVARILTNDISQKFDNYSLKAWPPNIEEILGDEMKPPDSVMTLVKAWLKSVKDKTPNITRISDPLSQDTVYNVLVNYINYTTEALSVRLKIP